MQGQMRATLLLLATAGAASGSAWADPADVGRYPYASYAAGYAGDYAKLARDARDPIGAPHHRAEAGALAAEPSSNAWGDYVKEYAGEHIPEIGNTSDWKSWRDAFVKEYAAPYRHYIQSSDEMANHHPTAPRSADECRTLGQLRSWRDFQHEVINSYVPTEHRAFINGAVEQEYHDRKEQIEASEQAEANKTEASKQEEEETSIKPVEAKKEKADKSSKENEEEKPSTKPSEAKKEEVDNPKSSKKEEERKSNTKPSEVKGTEPSMAARLMLVAHGPSHEDSAGEAPTPSETGPSAAKGHRAPNLGIAERYMKEYAGDRAPMPNDPSDAESWQDAFVDRFASRYRKYLEGSKRLSSMYRTTPIRAEDCHSMASLRMWRDAQRDMIDTFMPQEDFPFVAGAVEQEYERNQARVEQEEQENTPHAQHSRKADLFKAGASELAELEVPEDGRYLLTQALFVSAAFALIISLSTLLASGGVARRLVLWGVPLREADLGAALLRPEGPLAV